MKWTPARPEEPRHYSVLLYSICLLSCHGHLQQPATNCMKWGGPPNIPFSKHSVWLQVRLSIIFGGLRLKDEPLQHREYSLPVFVLLYNYNYKSNFADILICCVISIYSQSKLLRLL